MASAASVASRPHWTTTSSWACGSFRRPAPFVARCSPWWPGRWMRRCEDGQGVKRWYPLVNIEKARWFTFNIWWFSIAHRLPGKGHGKMRTSMGNKEAADFGRPIFQTKKSVWCVSICINRVGMCQSWVALRIEMSSSAKFSSPSPELPRAHSSLPAETFHTFQIQVSGWIEYPWRIRMYGRLMLT